MLNQTLRNMLVICLITLLLSIDSFSQTTNSDSSNTSKQVKDYVIDVYFINGYALGYQIYANTNSEIRLLLDLVISGSAKDEDRTEEDIYDMSSSSQQYAEEENKNTHSISLIAHYLSNIFQSKYGKVYWGIGPKIGYNWSKTTSKYDQEDLKNNFSNTSNSFSIGVVALIGIRANLTQSLSLYAEAQISGSKNWSETNYENQYEYQSTGGFNKYKTTTDGDSWSYSLIYSRIGIRFLL